MGWGRAGLAGGIGAGLNKIGDMAMQYGMMKAGQAHQKDMQQNDPRLRLVAAQMLGKGGGGGGSMSAAAIGSPSFQAANQVVNQENYGKPGHPGGASDPQGNFNPATMPMEDMLGDPMVGLHMRNQHMSEWQQRTVPLANAYIESEQKYQDAQARLQAMDTEIPQIRQQAERTLRELGQQWQAAQGQPDVQQQISNEIEKVRMGLLKKEKEHGTLKQQMAGLEQAKREYGQQLSQLLPGLSIPEGESSLYANSGDPSALGPELAGPRHIAERVYPPGQIPASMASPNYLPVTPRDARR